MIHIRSECPKCGHDYDVNEARQFRDKTLIPTTGDFTVCIGCAQILVFANESLQLRLPTDEEMKKAQAHKGIRNIIRMVKTIRNNLNKQR